MIKRKTPLRTHRARAVSRAFSAVLGACAALLTTNAFSMGMDVTDYAVRYALDEGTGTAAADSAGNVADATLQNGADWSLDTPSQKGFALSFDGSNDSLDIPDDADINDYNGSRDNYSLSIWFKADDVSAASHQPIFEEGGTVNGLNIYLINGTLYAGAWSEGSSWNGAWASTSDVTSDTWHHAVLTLDAAAGELKLYLDGDLKDTQTGEGVEGHGGDVSIARVNGNTKFHDVGDFNGNAYYAGLADDFRVYHYTLNATQVDNIEMAGGPQMPHPDPEDDDRRMEHMALFSILKRTEASHVAVSDGDWSDTSIWMDGQVPGAGAKVVIVDGRTVTYDVDDSTTALDWIRVDGTLSFDPNTDTAILVETLAVDPVGTINLGTSSTPINANNTAEIIIDTTGGPIDQTWDTFAFTRGAIFHGVTNIYGAAKKAHTTLDGDALANASVIKLSDSSIPSGWQVGDTLVVAGTEVDTSLLNVGNKQTEIEDGDDENSRFKDELLEITAMNVVNGHVEVSFNNITNATAISNNRTTLLWDHERPSGATFSADELEIHVANLTRNVVFRSSDPTVDLQERGHTMVMHNPNANIQYAQFKDLGRTDKRKLIDDPAALGNFDGSTANGTNPRGRYSIHLHKAGTAGTKAIVEGNVVWGNPGWAIVHHDSFADLTENVVFDGVGAGIIAEDGNETGKWTRNLVIKMRGDLENNFDDNFFLGNGRTAMFDFGFNGSGYWVQGGGVRLILEDNVAASINGAGIDIFNTMDGDPKRFALPVSEIADPDLRQAISDDGYSEVTVNNLPMEAHTGTQIYNAYRGMFSWLHMRNSLNGKEFAFTFGTRVGHEYRSAVSDFKIWNVITGIQNFYSTRIDYSNGLVVGNVSNPVPFSGSSQANNSEGIGFSHNGNNANWHNFDNMRVEGFDYGFAVFRSLASNGEESPYAVSSLTNSEFANVNYALSPTSNNAAPYSDLFILDENTTFSTLLDGSNQDPTATFTSSAAGGYAVNLDASGSSDPDPLSDTTSGDDGIAAFAWDLDNDGQYDDAWGDKVVHIFSGAGSYPVAVKVWDGNGATDTYTTNVAVSATAYANPLLNGDFSGDAPAQVQWHGNIDSGDRGSGWIQTDDSWVVSSGALVSNSTFDRDDAYGVAQVWRDENVRKGTQTLSLDVKNTEASGNTNQVLVRIFGVDGRFDQELRGDNTPVEVEQYPFSLTTLLNADVGGSTFDWTNYSWDIDFGDGYEYILVQVSTKNTDSPNGDFVGIDDVSLTGAAPSGGDIPDITTTTLADATAGSAYSQSLSASGGDAPLIWSLGTGAPAWLSIDTATGELSGTPATQDAGTTSFDVTVTDADNDSDVQNLDLTVNFTPAGSPALSVSVWDGAGALSPEDGWQSSGTLANSYTNPVILASIAQEAGLPPAVPIVRMASGADDEFEIKLIQPVDAGTPDATADYDVTVLVVEAGSYTGYEAGTMTVDQVDSSGNWNGNLLTYAQSYTTPVIFGQVMAPEGTDPDWSVFWSARDNGGSVDTDNPADGSSAFIGRHVGEDSNTTRAQATLGYLVVEKGNVTIDGQNAYAELFPDSPGVEEIDEGGAAYLDLSASGFGSISSALAGTVEMDGNDGGWAILAKPDAISGTNVALAFQEDEMGDTEQNHTSEQVGVLAFDGGGGSTQLLSEDFADGDFVGWTEYSVNNNANWSASNGYATVNNRPVTWQYWDDSAATSWSDYTASVSILVDDDDPAGLMFYYQDVDNYYRAEIGQDNSASDTSDDYIKLIRVSGGSETELASTLEPLSQGTTYGVRVSVNSSGDITVEVDDGSGYSSPFSSVNDTTFTQGTVGIYADYHSGVRFDDILVTEN